MNPLHTFQNNSVQRDAVKAFMIQVLGEMAVEKAFGGESVVGIPQAKELVERVFDKLDEFYGKIDVPVISSSR